MDLTRSNLLDAYRIMRLIRVFEERLHLEFATGEIPGFVGATLQDAPRQGDVNRENPRLANV